MGKFWGKFGENLGLPSHLRGYTKFSKLSVVPYFMQNQDWRFSGTKFHHREFYENNAFCNTEERKLSEWRNWKITLTNNPFKKWQPQGGRVFHPTNENVFSVRSSRNKRIQPLNFFFTLPFLPANKRQSTTLGDFQGQWKQRKNISQNSKTNFMCIHFSQQSPVLFNNEIKHRPHRHFWRWTHPHFLWYVKAPQAQKNTILTFSKNSTLLGATFSTRDEKTICLVWNFCSLRFSFFFSARPFQQKNSPATKVSQPGRNFADFSFSTRMFVVNRANEWKCQELSRKIDIKAKKILIETWRHPLAPQSIFPQFEENIPTNTGIYFLSFKIASRRRPSKKEG